MNLSQHIGNYEDRRLSQYMKTLDVHDQFEMAVEHEYQFLCECAMALRIAMRGQMTDALDKVLWDAAEAHIESLANTSEDD